MSDNLMQQEQLIRALDQYETLIFSICYRMTHHYFDAQDLTQETFLAFYQKLPEFDGQNEKGYLTRIATNKCLDYLKQAERRAIPSEHQMLEGYSGTAPPPEEEVLQEEIDEMLKQMCQSLKPPYDRVAEAHFCGGQTAAQIAAESGGKLKTIQTQIARARKMLQRKYQREEGCYETPI